MTRMEEGQDKSWNIMKGNKEEEEVGQRDKKLVKEHITFIYKVKRKHKTEEP